MKNKLNKNLKLFNTNGSIIEENGEIHLVKDIVNDGDFIFSNIANKSLVLLLCKNQYESVFFYINSISRGIVPILIDSESDYSLISSLIIKYQPEYIFSPASNNLTFDNYHICGSFREFSLLKYTEIKLTEINHKLGYN